MMLGCDFNENADHEKSMELIRGYLKEYPGAEPEEISRGTGLDVSTVLMYLDPKIQYERLMDALSFPDAADEDDE